MNMPKHIARKPSQMATLAPGADVVWARMTFGPFPVGFWNDLARYNPFRFRVLHPTAERRSEWVEFEIVPEEETS